MVKMNMFLTRRADLTREQFGEYWEKKHWPIILSIPEAKTFTKRYVQQHNIGQVPPGITAAPYDGIAEAWFETIEDVYKLVGAQAWKTIVVKDEENFLDRSKTVLMFSEEKVNYEG